MPNIRTALGIMKTLSNWPLFFANYLRLVNQKEVTYKFRNGMKYKARSKTTDSGIITETWIHRFYTPKGFEIHQNDIVFDVGAQIGSFSLFASMYAKKGKIYAFEPVPDNFRLLKENIKINRIKNIVPINKAIAEKEGKKEFYLSSVDTGGHSFYPVETRMEKTIVNAVTLKKFITENNIKKINFIKIDCEGAEYVILLNLPDKILKKIDKISMEYHRMGDTHLDLKKFLECKGFYVELKEHGSDYSMLYAHMINDS